MEIEIILAQDWPKSEIDGNRIINASKLYIFYCSISKGFLSEHFVKVEI